MQEGEQTERQREVDFKKPHGRQHIAWSSTTAVAISGVPNVVIEFYFQSYKYVNFTAPRGTESDCACNNRMRTFVTQF